ncbi:MAG: prolyl oligopeptidase [Candidatus Krumholzibacteriia bacterium]|jgi:prolyl oligopeptidase
MRLGLLVILIIALLVVAYAFADDHPEGDHPKNEHPASDDPYLWLEEVDGEKALAWVKETSDADTAELETVPVFKEIHETLLDIYNSSDRIPSPALRGEVVYNFWQDDDHVRGIWRRTSVSEYVKENPQWETVIDVDKLATENDENWVWKGASGLEPAYEHFLISLSRGGGDATVVREFNATTGEWVADGFNLPEAKSRMSWKDKDTVWVGTDFGEGSLTTSGYPRIAKEWSRGTELSEAKTVLEGDADGVSSGVYSMHNDEGRYDFSYQIPEFYKGSYGIFVDGEHVALDFPIDADPHGVFKDQFLLGLRSDWEVGGNTYPADALLAIGVGDFLKGGRDFEVLFEATERVSFGSVSTTKNKLLVTTLDNVRSKLYEYKFDGSGWTNSEVELPGLGTAGISAASDVSDTYFVTYTDFTTPSSLLISLGEKPLERVKSTPDYFDTDGMNVEQFEATSADGTKIPYFMFTPKGYEANGKNPTMLYGYGGFEVSMRPNYSATLGTSWVGRGGVYVLANIRGGGEFGPKWHKGAVRENHQNAFDDFIAIGEDLVARNVTSPKHLGIAGGSNGGLLVGACFVQRPDLFEGVVCQVPLLDMKRYNKLLAGASWMAEYGNPDTEDWEYMKTWSPYQNLDESADYPKVFFTTSTRDDRVHPGHARKMVKKMLDMGKPVYYYENMEGGHGGAANMNQRAYMWALTYAYLWKTLE